MSEMPSKATPLRENLIMALVISLGSSWSAEEGIGFFEPPTTSPHRPSFVGCESCRQPKISHQVLAGLAGLAQGPSQSRAPKEC
ncbi:hypothetical protein QC763_0008850 [Podospora pseudopauciseta]|uniref:Secreted protein n=1 Tax=Podospora pseudopauciseta TaxID=2093780 RepID=A0ABR0HXU5_9PEZI|nr:hypothetical protein QC763_0008850 [Podospora pseudopauciseta]